MNKQVLRRLKELAEHGGTVEILTLAGAPDAYTKNIGDMLVVAGDETEGQLLDSKISSQAASKIASMEWTKPVVIELEAECGRLRVFWDRLERHRSVLVLGAGHVSQPLVSILMLVGYEVTVVDDRPDFANTARFPQGAQVICQTFSKALTDLSLSGFGAIVIVTRGHRSDMDCLRAVVNLNIPYVGMIGSQGRVRVIMKALAEEGVSPDSIKRLKAPIGLDLGAETPAEIALSIAAEITAAGRKVGYLPLSDKWREK